MTRWVATAFGAVVLAASHLPVQSADISREAALKSFIISMYLNANCPNWEPVEETVGKLILDNDLKIYDGQKDHALTQNTLKQVREQFEGRRIDQATACAMAEREFGPEGTVYPGLMHRKN
ncbi:MAG: hypothetical protein LBR29_04410 [Methylobacteriaceae bacterium]|jgi:hypothetical protein|nr:hypothetical protein [Methylobacteriaceae bacterium]